MASRLGFLARGVVGLPPQGTWGPWGVGQCRGFAARKGTRTRKESKKVKKENVKRDFLFKNVRKQLEMPYVKQRPFDDSHYATAVDDVYFSKLFRTKEWPFAEAIQNMRETHHPTVFNVPDAPVFARVNIDLRYPNRPNKCQDSWRSVIEMKASFLLTGMARPSVIAFCPEDSDYISEVLKAGADIAGSKEIVKSIQEGELNANDYEYIVSHPTMVPELSVIRGLIKKKFPMIKNKTISTDLVSEVQRLKSGMKVRLERSDREPDYGFFELPIGTLDMSTEGLEGNFLSILNDTVPRRVSGKTPEQFIISCVLSTPTAGYEKFKVDIRSYLENFSKPQSKLDDSSRIDKEVEQSQPQPAQKQAAQQ